MDSGRNKKKQITQTCRTSLKSMTTRHGRLRRPYRQTDVGAYEEFVSLVTAIKIWTNPARVSHTNYHNLQIFQRKRPPPTTASKQQEQKFLVHLSGSWGQQTTSPFLSFYCHWVRLKEKASRDRWFNLFTYKYTIDIWESLKQRLVLWNTTPCRQEAYNLQRNSINGDFLSFTLPVYEILSGNYKFRVCNDDW